MKALVLGGTGFVGMNVTRALVQAGHDVAATRRPNANTLFARRLGARLVSADLSDVRALTETMRGREVVFMCAGHYPRYSLDRDAEVARARALTACCVDAALRAGVQRFVLTSSVATVGPSRWPRDLSNESDPVAPRAACCVYHAVKIAIEYEVVASAARGLDVVVVCPTGILGALDVKAGTGFVVVALGNGLLPVYVDGRTNIVDADDMARAQVLAAERGRTGERYILAGHNTTVREVLELIADELDVALAAWRIPLAIAGALSTFDEMRCACAGRGSRPFLSREFVDIVRFGLWVDPAKAMRELELPPSTPLPQTVRKACTWFERHHYFKRRQPGLAPA